MPDAVVRRADQIELVDMTPEALRRRMAHGNVYPPERVDAALGNYFRVGNLTALRELALLWLADRVDEGLQRYKAEHHIDHVWEARERVVVALTGGPEGETLIRRASRVAQRVGQRRPARRARARLRRPDRRLADGPARAARAGREPRRQLPPGRRRRRRRRAAGVRPQRRRHPARHRHQPAVPLGPRAARRHRRAGGRRLRRHRRAHRHARRRPAPGGWRLPPLTGAPRPPAAGWLGLALAARRRARW